MFLSLLAKSLSTQPKLQKGTRFDAIIECSSSDYELNSLHEWVVAGTANEPLKPLDIELSSNRAQSYVVDAFSSGMWIYSFAI